MSLKLEALRLLKARIANNGLAKKIEKGIVKYIDAPILQDDQLDVFLDHALCSVNCFPPFTNITFEDAITKHMMHHIVQMAVVYVMFTMSLVERGREYHIVDNGVDYKAPNISDLLFQAYQAEKDCWYATISDAKQALANVINQLPQ